MTHEQEASREYARNVGRENPDRAWILTHFDEWLPNPFYSGLPVSHPEDDFDDGYCSNPGGHEWAYTGTQYGGDDESYFGEGRCYCMWCGADGDA